MGQGRGRGWRVGLNHKKTFLPVPRWVWNRDKSIKTRNKSIIQLTKLGRKPVSCTPDITSFHFMKTITCTEHPNKNQLKLSYTLTVNTRYGRWHGPRCISLFYIIGDFPSNLRCKLNLDIPTFSLLKLLTPTI